ncbi:hypothetical protein [Streptomyces sp. G1]|uniref:hypothetical protein n=1 Tax=Streptomyces sp. G1 TaxID=361572 RepID=UPI00202EBED8|nr:hypothetical protein [Streptomyces sp. G1]MCM1972992.1 hypothetical protein [Streptomyces sp. G1]
MLRVAGTLTTGEVLGYDLIRMIGKQLNFTEAPPLGPEDLLRPGWRTNSAR